MLNLCKARDFPYRTLRGRYIITSMYCSKEDSPPSEDAKLNDKSKSERRKKAVEDDSSQEETAAERLNRLLMSIQTTDNQLTKRMSNVLPLPGELNRKKRSQKKTEAESKDIFNAAAKVASHLNEEKKQQIESELLSKLLGRHNNNYVDNNNTGQNIKQASKESDISITELIVGMKIDRSQKPIEIPSRGEYVKRSIDIKKRQQTELRNERHKKHLISSQRKSEAFTGNVDLFSGASLSIFNKPNELKVVPDILKTWSNLQEKLLKMQVSRPPANYFEKIARWTEQGKVWRFPIDNEQDWIAEHNVDFSEHIFLDHHLESWCPQRGPVRHFMELVCVGLSKNPYLTAKEKKEHILWYRDYFESKKELLQEAIDKESPSQVKLT